VAACCGSGFAESMAEHDGWVTDVASNFEDGGRSIGGDDVGDDFAFVRANIHEEIPGATEFVDGGEDGFRGVADLRELGVVGDERE
jgi:hypothetical protein